MINQPILASGISNYLPPPTDKDRVELKARDCLFFSVNSSKPLNFNLPASCKTAMPVNGTVTVEYRNRFYLFGVNKGFWREGAEIAKGSIIPRQRETRNGRKITII
jgi:hypothetical protein